MKKTLIILMLCCTTCYASLQLPGVPSGKLTPEDMGITSQTPDYVGAMMKSMKDAEELRIMSAQIKAQQLQNEMMVMQMRHYLATHPQIVRDIANKEEAQKIIEHNSGFQGLFRNRTIFLNELKQCANHRNKYCLQLLREEKQKNRSRLVR